MSYFLNPSSNQSLYGRVVCKALKAMVLLGLACFYSVGLADDKFLIPDGMREGNAKSAKFQYIPQVMQFHYPPQVILGSKRERRPNPNINFYACKFDYVTTFNDLIEQFYLNLGGKCLREISTERLAKLLGVNIIEKRSKERIFRVKDSRIKGIRVIRTWDSFVIEATKKYLEEHGSLFQSNILPPNLPKPFILITLTQPDENMRGDLLNIRYIVNYSWSPLPSFKGGAIRFSHKGDSIIKKITISW